MTPEQSATLHGIEDALAIVRAELADHVKTVHHGERYGELCTRCLELIHREQALIDEYEREGGEP